MRELTARVRDWIPDLLDRVLGDAASLPVPPPAIRRNVGRTSSRDDYLEGGAIAITELLVAFFTARSGQISYPVWLDFGCGAARISRYLTRVPDCTRPVGVDVDSQAIEWAKGTYPNIEFQVIQSDPPLPFAPASVHVVIAASVFTHFDEPAQFRWLSELKRVLAPGGLLIASTHGPHLASARPDLTGTQLNALSTLGFAYAPGRSFNAATAFHSRTYLEREWGRFLELRWYREHGLFQYQDLGVWASAT